jgi:hypothetical protein
VDISVPRTLMTAALGALISYGTVSEAADSPDTWQRKRLFHPTETQRRAEERGQVFIYEGLKDTEVEHVMDEEFPRVESMMFTGTVVTDDRGEPKVDSQTGAVVVEQDGCD